MHIRQANEHDIESLFELWKEMRLPHSDYHPEYYPLADEVTIEEKIKTRLLSMIQDPEYCFSLAQGGNSIVGYCIASTEAKPPIYESITQLHILQAIVTKAHRKRGVFKRLLNAVRSWGIEKGATEIELLVDSRNLAVKAYEACGFEIIQYKMVLQATSSQPMNADK